MRINVTAAHIAAGVPGSARCCPVALAISEHVPPDCPVLVRFASADIDGDSFWLPTEAQDFICNFDENLPVSPFEFPLADRVL